MVRTEDGTAVRCADRPAGPPGPAPLVAAEGPRRARRDPEQAAIREVEEETGISGRITARLGSVEYTFIAQGRRIHKRVHHYLMEAVAGELSDADVEVTEVAWVPLTDLAGRLAYAGERRLARRAVELLADTA